MFLVQCSNIQYLLLVIVQAFDVSYSLFGVDCWVFEGLMFIVQCPMFVIECSMFVVHCWNVRCLLFCVVRLNGYYSVFKCSMFVIQYSMFVVLCSVLVVQYSNVRYMLFNVACLLFFIQDWLFSVRMFDVCLSKFYVCCSLFECSIFVVHSVFEGSMFVPHFSMLYLLFYIQYFWFSIRVLNVYV